MNKYLQAGLHKLNSNKFAIAFIVVASALAVGTTSVASAAPDYFNVAKPSSQSQCEGGSWQTVNRGHWWHRHRTQVWIPNWEKLGFKSHDQCVRYVSTNAPTSKQDCKDNWRTLGFRNRGDCFRYLRQHPGNGYGGDQRDNDNDRDDD